MPAIGTSFALDGVAHVGDDRGLKISPWRHVAEVVVEFVGAADHVVTAAECGVHHSRKSAVERLFGKRWANRANVTAGPGKELLDFLGGHGTEIGDSETFALLCQFRT